MTALARSAIRPAILGAPFVVAFIALFLPTLLWMAERFGGHDSFYSHGWLVPVASGWLIWQRRLWLKTCRVEASFSGLALLAPALLLHTVGVWWGLHVLSGLAMLGALWGLVWMLWGRQVLWSLRLPMLFLLFMIPLPGVFVLSASFHLKLLAAAVATHAVRGLGIPVVQAGSTIQAPGISVIVDDTCSGLRSLLSLIALAVLWASMLPSSVTRWKRVAVAIASIPIALSANAVRIIVLVLIAVIYGPEAAQGFVHYGSGLVVFGVALAVLAWLSQAFARPPSGRQA